MRDAGHRRLADTQPGQQRARRRHAPRPTRARLAQRRGCKGTTPRVARPSAPPDSALMTARRQLSTRTPNSGLTRSRSFQDGSAQSSASRMFAWRGRCPTRVAWCYRPRTYRCWSRARRGAPTSRVSAPSAARRRTSAVPPAPLAPYT